MKNNIKGKLGEEIAQKYLIDKGFKILETNFRYSKISEIDIIACRDDILHFVEVKTRTNGKFGSPLEAVTKTKLSSIYTGAKYYLSNTKKHYKKVQIDAIGIIADNNGQTEITFLEDISLN